MALFIGVDIGQKRDPTAIAVAETDQRQSAHQSGDTHFVIRYLHRLPLGTPYPEVARRIAEVAEKAQARSNAFPIVFLDATGVGKPVVDLVSEGWLHGDLYAVYFTHGDRRRVDGQRVTLGKAHLVSRLQALLQAGRIHLPPTLEARALAEELLDYEIRVDEQGKDRYGAFRTGTHDDLVTALGLAVQGDDPGLRHFDSASASVLGA
ncbi:MAG: hypothetical protein AAF481_07855 [Acidobacteriota bacterium]